MNCCRETVEKSVPRAAQALAPRAGQPQGVGSEAYLNGTSQGPTPEDARKDDHIIRARYAPLSPASGFPVSWSQQVIHEISGLTILPVNASTWKNFSTRFPVWVSLWLPARTKRSLNLTINRAAKKHPSRFVGCEGHFYGLGLLVKYDKKP